jgi:hypothetical protein
MNPLFAFLLFNFSFLSEITRHWMSVGTRKGPRSKRGGEVEERWRRGGGTMEEDSRFIANSSLFYMCLRLVISGSIMGNGFPKWEIPGSGSGIGTSGNALRIECRVRSCYESLVP